MTTYSICFFVWFYGFWRTYTQIMSYTYFGICFRHPSRISTSPYQFFEETTTFIKPLPFFFVHLGFVRHPHFVCCPYLCILLKINLIYVKILSFVYCLDGFTTRRGFVACRNTWNRSGGVTNISSDLKGNSNESAWGGEWPNTLIFVKRKRVMLMQKRICRASGGLGRCPDRPNGVSFCFEFKWRWRG